jgi:hypothetical protein
MGRDVKAGWIPSVVGGKKMTIASSQVVETSTVINGWDTGFAASSLKVPILCQDEVNVGLRR